MTAMLGEPPPATATRRTQALRPAGVAGALLVPVGATVSAMPWLMIAFKYFGYQGMVWGMPAGDPPTSTVMPLLLFSAIGFAAAGWHLFKMPVWAAAAFGACLSPVLPPVMVAWDLSRALTGALALACAFVVGFVARRALGLPPWVAALVGVLVPLLTVPFAAAVESHLRAW
jgi:hypothetical protein